jgi:hypothetical protein
MPSVDIDKIYKVYQARIEECQKAKEHCAQVIKTQRIILQEIRKGNADLSRAIEQYLEVNQQILTEISNVIYKNEKDHSVMIALLMAQGKNVTADDVIDKILAAYSSSSKSEQNIHIKTGRDANLTEINKTKE